MSRDNCRRQPRVRNNRYPCCDTPTFLHHSRHPDDAVLERTCPTCGASWLIAFGVEGIWRVLTWHESSQRGAVPAASATPDTPPVGSAGT